MPMIIKTVKHIYLSNSILKSVHFPLCYSCSNHAWVSFHGFSEAYNEYATDLSSDISSYTTATGGLVFFVSLSKKRFPNLNKPPIKLNFTIENTHVCNALGIQSECYR